MHFVRTLLKAARERLDSPLGRFLLVVSCVLVFTFAFHAKVAVYHHSGHPDTSTASKMWLTADRGQLPTQISEFSVLLFLLWFSLLVQCQAVRHQQEHRSRPVPSPLTQLNLRRFFRPPPLA